MRNAVFLAATIVLTATVSSAQADIGLSAYAGGGVVFPLDNVSTNWKPGYHGMIGAGVDFTAGLESVIRYSYHSFPADMNFKVQSESIANPGQDLVIQEIGLDIQASLSPPDYRFRLYGLIGAGLAKMPYKNRFVYCIGGGFKVATLPKADIFIEVRYVLIPFDSFNVTYIPITIGLNVNL